MYVKKELNETLENIFKMKRENISILLVLSLLPKELWENKHYLAKRWKLFETVVFSSLRMFCIFSFCSVTKLCLPLCNPMNSSAPGFPVLHYLLEFTQIHIHWVSDAIVPLCIMQCKILSKAIVIGEHWRTDARNINSNTRDLFSVLQDGKTQKKM